MKTNKILRGVLAAALALILLGVAAGAASYPSREFSLSDDGSRIESEGKSWKRIKLPSSYAKDPVYIYRFSCGLAGDSSEPSVLYVWEESFANFDPEVYGEKVLYVNEEAEKQINEFISGKKASSGYIGKSVHYMKKADPDLCEALHGTAAAEEFDGGYLNGLDRFCFFEYDATGTVRRTAGTLFKDGEKIIFVDHTKLGNPYFYADGTLALNAGEKIPAAVLGGNTGESVSSILSDDVMYYGNYDLPVYEDEPYSRDGHAGGTANVLFWAAFAFAGFVLPLGVMIAGIALSVRKRPGAARWRALIYCAAVWIIAAGVSAALMIFGV